MFINTKKQLELEEKLVSNARHILAFGGSRSGKTFKLVRSVLVRAAKAPKSKHAILRSKFNHCKQSIWHDTFPKVQEFFPDLPIKENKDMWYKELPNGSQIWIGGLDDAERVEKILGNEYSTIYFNECSQIPYHSITTALTRLAENRGLRLKAYYDENPPSPAHWSYKLFIERVMPTDKSRKVDPNNYVSILMNPTDNAENLPEGYIDDILDSLPDEKRRRFLLGEWVADIEGAVYDEQLAVAEKSNKITRCPYDERHEVHTWWDIGRTDYTAIWFVQYIAREVRVIDYYQINKKKPTDFVIMLKEKGYNYGIHNLPFDAGHDRFEGDCAYQQFRDAWPSADWTVHKRTREVQSDLYAVRTFFSRCIFDLEKCYDGIEALRNYARIWDEKLKKFKDKPSTDWASHGADAFRYLAIGYRDYMGEELPDDSNAAGTPTFNQLMQKSHVNTGRRRI